MATNYDLGKVMMTYKGTWVSTGTYDILDVCYYEGSSYVSLIPNNVSNIYDTTAWGIIAQKGGIEVAGGTLDTAIAQAMSLQLQPITQSISGLQQDSTGLHNSVTEINQTLSNQQIQITTNQTGNQKQFNALGTQITTNTSNISGLSQTTQAQQQVLNDVSAHAIRTNPSVVLPANFDFNNETTLGQYLVMKGNYAHSPLGTTSVGAGQLLVFNVTSTVLGQLFIPDDQDSYQGGSWYRSYNLSSNTWNAWGHNVRTDSQGNLSVNDINLGSSGTLASTPAWSNISGKPDLYDKTTAKATFVAKSDIAPDISWHSSGFSYENNIQPIYGGPIARWNAVKLGNVQYVTLDINFTGLSGNGDIIIFDPNMPPYPGDSTVRLYGTCYANDNNQYGARCHTDIKKLAFEGYNSSYMSTDTWFHFEKSWWCAI